MRLQSIQPVLLCACLAAGLLFDPMGFLRMTLFCVVVHESAHVFVYVLCARRLPRLSFSAGGIELSGAQQISLAQENIVLAAGPAANFLLAAALFACLQVRASYGLYFLAAVSLCTGLYNLLPIGVLDGARLIQNMLPASKMNGYDRIKKLLLCCLCAAAVLAALCAEMPRGARAAAFLGPGYLLIKEFSR